jgi:threonine/homoserine/homoserine lactone efflux protein
VTLSLFLRGLAIGFAVAFALGPVGLLVIRRTLDRGWLHGFLSGVGVATTDALYAAIAAFGLTAISSLLVGIDRPLGVVGGAVLSALAIRTARSALRAGSEAAAGAERGRFDGPVGAWASMVVLTATNPATILSFAALFASIGAGTGGPGGAAAVVAGVFTGSLAWWALLTGTMSRVRTRLTSRVIRGLNLLSAIVIFAFGVIAITIGLMG